MRFSRNCYLLRAPNSPSFPDFHDAREKEREKRLSRVISRETTKSIQRWWNISGRRARDKLSPRPQLILAAERRLIASHHHQMRYFIALLPNPPPCSRLHTPLPRNRILVAANLSDPDRKRGPSCDGTFFPGFLAGIHDSLSSINHSCD